MKGLAKLVVTKAEGARQALADLVMAWARDIQTGEPRYILELDEHHRGAKCGCEWRHGEHDWGESDVQPNAVLQSPWTALKRAASAKLSAKAWCR